MSASVQVIGLESVTVRLQRLPDEIRISFEKAIAANAMVIESRVKEKLSGDVLNNRTGQLRASVHSEMQSDENGVMGVVGANTPYAAYQEYGFVGTEQVREHLRTMRMVFGRMLETPKSVLVKSFSRNVNYPGRSYLRSTLDEQADQIRADLEAAAQGALS